MKRYHLKTEIRLFKMLSNKKASFYSYENVSTWLREGNKELII